MECAIAHVVSIPAGETSSPRISPGCLQHHTTVLAAYCCSCPYRVVSMLLWCCFPQCQHPDDRLYSGGCNMQPTSALAEAFSPAAPSIATPVGPFALVASVPDCAVPVAASSTPSCSSSGPNQGGPCDNPAAGTACSRAAGSSPQRVDSKLYGWRCTARSPTGFPYGSAIKAKNLACGGTVADFCGSGDNNGMVAHAVCCSKTPTYTYP